MPEVELAIVGAGPAGLSTALHLLQRDPGWAGRMVVLEKASHPRPKLCAGGITAFGLKQLRRLGLSLDVPHVPVEEARLEYHGQRISIRRRPAFAVTRRSEFDSWLAGQVRSRGVALLEDHGVTALVRSGDRIQLSTPQGVYTARAIVGADGAKGIVRRWIGARERPPRVARLLETLTPCHTTAEEYRKRMARFNFSDLGEGLQGYYWDFPSIVAGEAYINSGVYDSRVRGRAPRVDLPFLLDRGLASRTEQNHPPRIEGHPIHWFSPWNLLNTNGVLLVGDAAGAEPLFGEGIAPALGYGEVAARSLERAFARGDFSFSDYRRRLLLSSLGGYMLLRWAGAVGIYHLSRRHHLLRLFWFVAGWLAAFVGRGRPVSGLGGFPAGGFRSSG